MVYSHEGSPLRKYSEEVHKSSHQSPNFISNKKDEPASKNSVDF